MIPELKKIEPLYIMSLNAITDPVVNGVPGVSYMNGLIMSYPYYLFALPNIMSSVSFKQSVFIYLLTLGTDWKYRQGIS